MACQGIACDKVKSNQYLERSDLDKLLSFLLSETDKENFHLSEVPIRYNTEAYELVN